MDKLKNGLAVAKKFHFWILCAAILAMGVGMWWVAKAGALAEFEERETTLEGKFSSVQGVSSRSDHPNQGVIDVHKATEQIVKVDVYKAWKKLYDEQKSGKVLPASFSVAFRDTFTRVLEARAKEEDAELPPPYRDE